MIAKKYRVKRAAVLANISYLKWKRVSRSRFDQLNVSLSEDCSTFYVDREGHPGSRKEFPTAREAEDYMMRYYNRVLTEGSGAPDDIFMDSMKSVTGKAK